MQVRKFLPIECDVIVVDGLWGVGKTAVTSVIGAMKSVEKMKLDHVHEYVCTMNHLDKMSDDATRFMLLTYADIDQYSNLIGREINFRPSDASGTKNTPGSTLKYLRRLFADDGDQIVDHIQTNNIALHVVSHQALPVGEPLFEAFGRAVAAFGRAPRTRPSVMGVPIRAGSWKNWSGTRSWSPSPGPRRSSARPGRGLAD